MITLQLTSLETGDILLTLIVVQDQVHLQLVTSTPLTNVSQVYGHLSVSY